MKVKEAKEIIATMELSDKTLDRAVSLLGNLTDEAELPEELLDQLLLLIDKESGVLEEEIGDEEVLAFIDEKNKSVVKDKGV